MSPQHRTGAPCSHQRFPDFLLRRTDRDRVCGFLSKKAAWSCSTPPTSPVNPGYVGRKRWAKPFDHFSFRTYRNFVPSLVSRITSYSVDTFIEATAQPSLKGTGQGPYMTQGHLELTSKADECQPRTFKPAQALAIFIRALPLVLLLRRACNPLTSVIGTIRDFRAV